MLLHWCLTVKQTQLSFPGTGYSSVFQKMNDGCFRARYTKCEMVKLYFKSMIIQAENVSYAYTVVKKTNSNHLSHSLTIP